MIFLLDDRFVLLVDAPSELVGGEILRAKLDGTGLELIAENEIPGIVETFLQLLDTPDSYTGAGLYLVRVKGDQSGLEFVPLSEVVDLDGDPTLLATFLDLTDTPNSYENADGEFVRVNSSALTFDNISFLDLTDAPPSFGPAGAFLRVNSGETALEFVTRILSFLGLDDTPNAYGVNDARKFVTVKNDLTGLEFTSDSSLDLTDGPNSYTGLNGEVLRVNNLETGVTVAPETFTSFISLNDTPAAYGVTDGGKFVVVEPVSAPTRLVFQTAEEIAAAPQSFLNLTDTPDSYTNQLGKFARVTPRPNGEIGLSFADVTILSSDAAQADLNLYKEEYVGGTQPSATGANSVAIGELNTASGVNSAVIGGQSNSNSADGGLIVGGFDNTLTSPGAIVGGTLNSVSGTSTFGLIGGGEGNEISGADGAIIGTGLNNEIVGTNSANSIIGGGLENQINITSFYNGLGGAIICGGQGNTVSGGGAVVLGGFFVAVTSPWSVAVASQSGRDAGTRRAVSADYSVMLGPQSASDNGWFGARPFATETLYRSTDTSFAVDFYGGAQTTTLLFAGETSNNSWTRLLLDSGINYGNRRDISGGYLSRITFLPDDGLYWINADIVARDILAPHSATFSLRGVVLVSNGEASLPNGFELLDVCRCGPGSSQWDVRLTTSGLCADIEVRGSSTQTINWLCKVKTLENLCKTSANDTFTLTPTNAFVDGGFTVNERAPGASICTISRPGGIDDFTFSSASTAFEITAAGVFKLRDNRTLNFEATPFLEITVYANSADENLYLVIPVRVLNVPEAPSNILLYDINTGSTSVRSVPSGAPGVRIAYVEAVDQDAGDTFTFTVVTGGATFEIIQENINGVLRNVLKLRNGVSITTQQVVRIRATDSTGLFREQNFTVTIR